MAGVEYDGPLFHGGVRGLHRGSLILPPSVTRAPSNADFGAGGACRRDRVYMTTEIDQACMFAILAPPKGRGAIYEVEPIGNLEVDPDYLGAEGASFAAPRARVVRVVERRVETFQGLTMQQVAAALTPDGDRYTSGIRAAALSGSERGSA